MSLYKKYLKVFQMGFYAGARQSNHGWNGETYDISDQDKCGGADWSAKLDHEVKIAVKDFAEYLEKYRL